MYYFNYPRSGFSLDLICAQIDDLVEELAVRRGHRPVILGVSFGAGIAIEWLRRARAAGRTADPAGLVLVSPVACIADVVDPDEPRPSTLLGRALQPYLDPAVPVDAGSIEKSRAVFSKMFGAGAQNRAALGALLTAGEFRLLRDGVMGTIRSIDFAGACERVQALRQIPAPQAWRDADSPPLCAAPALVLYAEKESAVIAENSPTRRALEQTLRSFFPGDPASG